MKKICVMAVLIILCSFPLMANEVKPVDIGINEKIGQTIPLDVKFFDEKGYFVALNEVVKKPTILNFVYFRCPGICSPILTELTSIVNKMDLELGRDYQILTISFNDKEKPELAAAKKLSYTGLLEKPYDENAWRFMTGDSASIYTMTNAAGFMFKKEGNDFVHAGALIVISPNGKIARYLYGTQYLPFDVKMALTEASEGKTGPTIARILQMCYSYNPEGRTYVFNVTRIAGIGILLFAVVFVIVISIKNKKVKA